MLASIGLSIVVWRAKDELPRWRNGGTNAIYHASLSPVGSFPLELSDRSSIYILGDSNTNGRGKIDQRAAYPAILAQHLRGVIEVKALGVGGDTAARGALRWNLKVRKGDLVVIVYGTNDAAPRGWLSLKRPVALPAFRARLSEIALRYRRSQANVLILPAFPTGSKAIERRLAPYRFAARDVAIAVGANFIDPVAAFQSASKQNAPLQKDAIHLTQHGHESIGKFLAENISVSAGVRGHRLTEASLLNSSLSVGSSVGRADWPEEQ